MRLWNGGVNKNKNHNSFKCFKRIERKKGNEKRKEKKKTRTKL